MHSSIQTSICHLVRLSIQDMAKGWETWWCFQISPGRTGTQLKWCWAWLDVSAHETQLSWPTPAYCIILKSIHWPLLWMGEKEEGSFRTAKAYQGCIWKNINAMSIVYTLWGFGHKSHWSIRYFHNKIMVGTTLWSDIMQQLRGNVIHFKSLERNRILLCSQRNLLQDLAHTMQQSNIDLTSDQGCNMRCHWSVAHYTQQTILRNTFVLHTDHNNHMYLSGSWSWFMYLVGLPWSEVWCDINLVLLIYLSQYYGISG